MENFTKNVLQSDQNQAHRNLNYAYDRLKGDFAKVVLLMEELNKADDEGREPMLDGYAIDLLQRGHLAMDVANMGAELSAFLTTMKAVVVAERNFNK